jgi:membrane-associated protein
MNIIHTLFTPELLIQTVGIAGIVAIIFAESGLLIGIFFPGDSLLFTMGILASQHIVSLEVLTPLVVLAAIAGDQIGYMTGKKFGVKIFSRPSSRFLTPLHIQRAQHFFEKYGKKTIILARFTPIIRTIAPIMAGMGTMNYGTFLTYNIIGGTLWCLVVLSLGYFLGSIVPNIDIYLLPIIILIVVVSLIPTIVGIFKKKSSQLVIH